MLEVSFAERERGFAWSEDVKIHVLGLNITELAERYSNRQVEGWWKGITNVGACHAKAAPYVCNQDHSSTMYEALYCRQEPPAQLDITLFVSGRSNQGMRWSRQLGPGQHCLL